MLQAANNLYAKQRHMTARAIIAFVGAGAIAACSALRLGSPPLPQNDMSMHRAWTRPRSSPIKHVVFIIQENRSFNNLFMGYPGATTAENYGNDKRGRKVALHAQGMLVTGVGTSITIRTAFFAACDGEEYAPRNPVQDGRLERGGQAVEYTAKASPMHTFRATRSSRIGRWRSSTSSRIKCSHRISTAASSRTNTPSPPMRVER